MKTDSLQLKRALRTALLVLLLNVVGLTKAYAYDFWAVCPTGQKLYYNITDDLNHYVELTYPKTGYPYWDTIPTGNIILPSSVNYDGVSYTVTEIGYNAFWCCSGLTGNLTIPNTVTTIAYGAFFQCSGFTGSLLIPNSVVEIGPVAFAGCSGFTNSLTIPASVASIGQQAFANCSNFTEVLYDAPNCGDYNGAFGPFEGCGGSLTIGNNVKKIPSSMFKHASFVGLVISNSVTEIGSCAFYRCSGFIGSLTIPNSVTTIGGGAFYDCCGFTAVYYTGDIAQWCSITYGSNSYNGYNFGTNPLYYAHNLYVNNELVTDLIIPEGITEIKPWTFCGATCLKSLSLPNSLRKIGYGAFYECSGFTGRLIIPNSVTEIGPVAFLKCSGFTGSLVIPNTLTSIEFDVFNGCSGLTGSLFIPNSVTTISYGAFASCSGFTGDLVIPESVTGIGYGAFCQCSGFTKVHFNPSQCSVYCPSIGPNYNWSGIPPFAGCGGSLEINENMEDIPAYLFKFANFKEITMYYSEPSILHNTIGAEAFAYCDSLQSIVCWNEEPPVLGEGVFAGVNKDNVIVHVPCGKAPTYKLADGWEEFPNYEMHLTAWLLTVTSNEPEHCETQIKQLPLCESGEAIVRAKPAPGYRFLGWYENDERVSQDTLYAFYLGTSRELEARVRSYTGLEDMVIVEANVYPNPISGQVKVEAENLKHITISNMFGQIIYDGNASGNEFAYDFSGYVAGVYLIRIETTSGVATKRVVVTR